MLLTRREKIRIASKLADADDAKENRSAEAM